MSKITAILTYERTGSGWLCDVMNTKESLCVHEMFTDDPLLVMGKFYELFKKIYNVDNEILKLLYNVYDPKNFNYDPQIYKTLKEKILNKNIYSPNLFDSIISLIKKHDKNFVFKLFPQHIKYVYPNKIVDSCDYVILNYRNNMVNSYLSLLTAGVSQKWYSYKNETNTKYPIVWNEKEYLDYVEKIKKKLRQLLEIYNMTKSRNRLTIYYEDIHENYLHQKEQAKIEYLSRIFANHDFDINTKYESSFCKQNQTYNIQNMEDYINSLSKIPRFVKDVISTI